MKCVTFIRITLRYRTFTVGDLLRLRNSRTDVWPPGRRRPGPGGYSRQRPGELSALPRANGRRVAWTSAGGTATPEVYTAYRTASDAGRLNLLGRGRQDRVTGWTQAR